MVVGEEPHRPYDRPPLSKKVLAGEWEPERTALRKPDQFDALRVDWRLGRRATALEGVFVLRTLDDSLALGRALDAGPRRVVVIGAGFIGAEVAATARGRGL